MDIRYSNDDTGQVQIVQGGWQIGRNTNQYNRPNFMHKKLSKLHVHITRKKNSEYINH